MEGGEAMSCFGWVECDGSSFGEFGMQVRRAGDGVGNFDEVEEGG